MGGSAFSTLAAKMTLDGSHFKAGIKEAESQVKHFGKDVLGELKGQLAAAFGAAALFETGRKVLEYASHVKDLSEQLQLTTDEVQDLGRAAIKSGQNLDFVAKKLEHLNEMRKKAGEHPFGEEAAALKKIGITDEMVQGPKKTVEFLGEISEEARRAQTASEDFTEAFGKMGEKMITIIDEIDKHKGEHNPFALDAEAIEVLDGGVKRYEEIQMRIRAAIGNTAGKITSKPWMALGPGGVFSFWQSFMGKGGPKHTGKILPEDSWMDQPEGESEPNKPRYYNLDAESQYHATMKAEADLANKIYEIKFKQADKMKQIQLLQEQKTKAVRDESYWVGQMNEAKDKTIENSAREEVLKARQRQADLDGKIYDTRHSMDSGRLQSSETHGFVTGGNASAGLGYYAHLGAMGTDSTSKQSLKEQEKAVKLLGVVATNTKPAAGKKAVF